MVDKNENVILNISNTNFKKNIEIRSNEISNSFKSKNYLNQKRNLLYKENKNKDSNILSTEENELFKNSSNYTYHKNDKNDKKRKLINESIYPVKIKKMAKTDIIIKEEDSKKNHLLFHNSTTDLSDIENKRVFEKINNGSKNDKYICDKCQKKYGIKDSFKKHLLTHQKKHYICPKCKALFFVNSKLKRHLLIHSNTKEFKCPRCDKAFNLNYNLKVHMRIHNNEKPYICGNFGCFAKFSQQNNLTTHLKIHTNNLIKEEKENNILLKFHNNILKFNTISKRLNSKLLELNKIALNG